MAKVLPKGQQARADFPRFGVWNYATFKAKESTSFSIQIGGDITPFTLTHADLQTLEHIGQVSDFHCVTTWSHCDNHWGGYRFGDFYKQFIQPKLENAAEYNVVIFKAQDRYQSSMFLEDALAEDVLLADQLDGKPLSAIHGAPLRLVAPAHYGYKNVKHLQQIEFRMADNRPKTLRQRLMNHPRGRVAYEERGEFLPGWLLRYIWRPLIGTTIRRMQPDA